MAIQGKGTGNTTITNVPGGADTDVQFNDGGATFGGNSAFTFDKTTGRLIVGTATVGNPAVGTFHQERASGDVNALDTLSYNDDIGGIWCNISCVSTLAGGVNGLDIFPNTGNTQPANFADGVHIDSFAGFSAGRNAAIYIEDQGQGTNDYAIKIDGGKASLDTTTYKAYAFADLPTLPAGSMAYITNSSTQTWGATIAAASPGSPVLGWYNGTNWTVVGK